MLPPPGKLGRVEAVDFAKDAACVCTCEGAPPGVVAAADEAASAGAGLGVGVGLGESTAACTRYKQVRTDITPHHHHQRHTITIMSLHTRR